VFQNVTQNVIAMWKPGPMVENSTNPVTLLLGRAGVDIVITIFCDFFQFSVKNWRFLKNQYFDHFLHNLASFLIKDPIFSKNIL
jgi:hypothetical protein